MGFGGSTHPMTILSTMPGSRWPTRDHFPPQKFNVFGSYHLHFVNRVFVSIPNMEFWGMANPILILPIMSDSKWPTCGHFYDKKCTFLLILSKLVGTVWGIGI